MIGIGKRNTTNISVNNMYCQIMYDFYISLGLFKSLNVIRNIIIYNIKCASTCFLQAWTNNSYSERSKTRLHRDSH